MSEIHRITVDPGQCGGRPCLRSLRIRARDVLDLLAAGATREEILATIRCSNPAISRLRSNTPRSRATIPFCA
jgi:uncharacterized protein (DUF433 family)